MEIVPLRALVLPMEKNFVRNAAEHLSHVSTAPFALVKPLFHLPREGEGKQMEPDTSWCDVFDDDGVA
jgi:hypothetical protein